MTKAEQLLASPDFNLLPIDVQNRLLIQTLFDGSSVATPATTPAPIVDQATIQQQGVIVHKDGQPFLLVPLQSDPTGGIQTPVSQVQGPGVMDIAKTTLGGVGDGLKSTVGLGLGLVGSIANLAVDLVTFGQSRGVPQQIGK